MKKKSQPDDIVAKNFLAIYFNFRTEVDCYMEKNSQCKEGKKRSKYCKAKTLLIQCKKER